MPFAVAGSFIVMCGVTEFMHRKKNRRNVDAKCDNERRSPSFLCVWVRWWWWCRKFCCFYYLQQKMNEVLHWHLHTPYIHTWTEHDTYAFMLALYLHHHTSINGGACCAQAFCSIWMETRIMKVTSGDYVCDVWTENDIRQTSLRRTQIVGPLPIIIHSCRMRASNCYIDANFESITSTNKLLPAKRIRSIIFPLILRLKHRSMNIHITFCDFESIWTRSTHSYVYVFLPRTHHIFIHNPHRQTYSAFARYINTRCQFRIENMRQLNSYFPFSAHAIRYTTALT